SVLVEQNNVGRAENFALIKLESRAQAKSIVKVNVTGVENNYLIGNTLS
ncbi:miaB-like tRNA modifying enzyme domain protein, partial [Wolbachia pipientis wUni]